MIVQVRTENGNVLEIIDIAYLQNTLEKMLLILNCKIVYNQKISGNLDWNRQKLFNVVDLDLVFSCRFQWFDDVDFCDWNRETQ